MNWASSYKVHVQHAPHQHHKALALGDSLGCGRMCVLPYVLLHAAGASVAQQDVLVEEIMNPKPVLLQEDMSIK